MTVAKTLFNQRIPTRDGIELAADVLLPSGEAPFPTVVVRTAYMRQEKFLQRYIELVDYGYALAAVDVRGRGDSEGEFTPVAARPRGR